MKEFTGVIMKASKWLISVRGENWALGIVGFRRYGGALCG